MTALRSDLVPGSSSPTAFDVILEHVQLFAVRRRVFLLTRVPGDGGLVVERSPGARCDTEKTRSVLCRADERRDGRSNRCGSSRSAEGSVVRLHSCFLPGARAAAREVRRGDHACRTTPRL